MVMAVVEEEEEVVVEGAGEEGGEVGLTMTVEADLAMEVGEQEAEDLAESVESVFFFFE
jgi:hypothetical protein